MNKEQEINLRMPITLTNATFLSMQHRIRILELRWQLNITIQQKNENKIKEITTIMNKHINELNFLNQFMMKENNKIDLWKKWGISPMDIVMMQKSEIMENEKNTNERIN